MNVYLNDNKSDMMIVQFDKPSYGLEYIKNNAALTLQNNCV